MTDKELGIPILSKYKKEEMGELISKYIDNLSKKEKSLLIEKCGISKMQLYNILKGKSIPHYRNFKQIADILNIKEREITKIVEGNIYYFCSYYPF